MYTYDNFVTDVDEYGIHEMGDIMVESIFIHDGVKVKVVYDQDTEMFRGEILGLTGTLDFYAPDFNSLKEEMDKSVRVYLDVCKENGINPV